MESVGIIAVDLYHKNATSMRRRKASRKMTVLVELLRGVKRSMRAKREKEAILRIMVSI